MWLSVPFPTGQLLSFDIGDQPVFEIPLSNVSQCTTGKNEVTLEFHQNDDAEVSLMEVRFYVPPTQEDGVDPVEVRPPLVSWEQMVLSRPWVAQEQDLCCSIARVCSYRPLPRMCCRRRM